MAEGTDRIRKVAEGIGILAVPAAVYYLAPDHPAWVAVSAVAAAGVKFAGKVWDRLESRYVDAVAKALPPKIESLVTQYRARYRRAIYFQHRSFDVKGLKTQGAFSLELDQVFVELSLSPEPPHKVPTDPLRKPIEAGERHEIWEFLKNDKCGRLAILGPPGSGKTTLLKHVALALAGPRRKRPLRLTPMLLYLRDLAKDIPALTLPQAIERSLPKRFETPEGWVTNELERNRCLILLDGLDEVADTQARRAVAKWIEARMQEYGDTRFVLTSRPNGYLSNPLDGVTVLDVKPFTWPQVERFVKNWYLATETVRAGKRDAGVELEAEKGAQDLLQRMEAAPALTDLAVNPLLLTMITTVHKERNSLPGRRVELYNEICEVFLGKRQASKGLALDLTPAQKRRVLEPLAWHMMERKVRKISVDDAHTRIAPVLALVDPKVNAPQFLENVRDESGLMIEQEKGEYAFAHLTFQEYLASTHAKAAALETELVGRVSEPWWMETNRLYAAQNDATRIVEACLSGDPSVESLSLAMDCTEESLELRPAVRARVEDTVIAGLESEEGWWRKIAAEVLLARYVRSMGRVADDRHCSKELVPNAIYELFLWEEVSILPPSHWQYRRFPRGESRLPATGVTVPAAEAFCAWLNGRYGSKWRFDLSGVGERPGVAACWVRVERWIECHDLPGVWLVRARKTLQDRLSREDYSARFAALARDLDIARDIARDLAVDRARAFYRAHSLDLDLRRAFDLGRALARARALELVLETDLARARDRYRVGALARDHALYCASEPGEVEVLSLFLLGLVRPGTPSEEPLGDLFLAAALALEQQAGTIPPPPVGIAVVRTTTHAARKAAGA